MAPRVLSLFLLAIFILFLLCPTPVIADAPQGSIVYMRSAAEPPTVWWGRRETRHPQGAEEEIPGLQGREEKTVKEEEIPTISPVHIMGNVRLTSLTRSESVFREGSVMCFTES